MEGSQQGFLLFTTCFRQLLSKEEPKMCDRAPNNKIKKSMNQWHWVLKASPSLPLKEKTVRPHIYKAGGWILNLLLTPWL